MRELEGSGECRNKDVWPEVEKRGGTKSAAKFGELPRGASWSDEGTEEPATTAHHEFIENLVFEKL